MFEKHILFNQINSLDMGLIINSIDLGIPTPKIIMQEVPYMNGSYDFSTVNNGGVPVFNNRTVIIKFSYKDISAQSQWDKYLKATSWLLNSPKGILDISTIQGKINGKCVSCSKLDRSNYGGTFTATFTCDPQIIIGLYGDYLWDPFNFDIGIAELNSFSMTPGTKLSVYCDVASAIPILTVDSYCKIQIQGQVYSLSEGVNNVFGLHFNYGVNIIEVLSGRGRINIEFKKELI